MKNHPYRSRILQPRSPHKGFKSIAWCVRRIWRYETLIGALLVASYALALLIAWATR